MKRFTPLLAVFAAGLVAASFAAAGPPPGKGNGQGKHDSTSGTTTSSPAACRPRVSTILKGTFVAAGGSGFSMDVTHANHHGHALLGMQTIAVDAKTTFKRNGHAKLTDFVAGDRLNVQARTCKLKHGETAPAGSPAQLLAKRVVGHPAKSGSGESTTTTTP